MGYKNIENTKIYYLLSSDDYFLIVTTVRRSYFLKISKLRHDCTKHSATGERTTCKNLNIILLVLMLG